MIGCMWKTENVKVVSSDTASLKSLKLLILSYLANGSSRDSYVFN